MADAAYHVDGQAVSVDTQLNGAGTGIEDVHVVPYVIDSGPAKGQRRTVKVPASQWDPASVKAAIEADINVAHAVASLRQPAAGM